MMKRADVNWRDPRANRNKNHNGSVDETKTPVLSLANQARFEGDFPVFQYPKYVGSFSLDEQRQYCPDRSQLRYLYLPVEKRLPDGTWKVDFDLRKGVTCVIEKNQEQVRMKMLDDLLHWILREREAGNWTVIDPVKPHRPLTIEVVCFRGLLTMIMASPYEYREGWTIVAAKLQNTVYLWQIKEAEEGDDRNSRAHEMSVWGFKFEQYLCTDSPGSPPNPDEQLNTNAEFCCIVKTRLAGRALLYGAEVDAIRPDGLPPWPSPTGPPPDAVPTLKSFVELKTTRHIETERQRTNFQKFKLMKWWAQSFLVGIPTVICGYRDDDGVVDKLEEMPVEKLRKMGEDYWMPGVMMNFCQQFLEFVTSSFTDAPVPEPVLAVGEEYPSSSSSSPPDSSNPRQHFIFEFDPKRRAVTKRPGIAGVDLDRSLLPEWYIEAIGCPFE